MTKATIVALAVTLLFALTGPALIRRLPPGTATRVFAPACLLVAACDILVFAVVGFTWIAQLGPVGRYGDWSAGQLRAGTPIPIAVEICCAVLALAALIRTVLTGSRRARALIAVRSACRRLGEPGSLVVLDTQQPDAFATPGAAGRIVVTTGLLRALSACERQALIAHERSHLAHRHARWLLAVDLAAAASPPLAPTARAIRHAVERWADEDAARAVNDRSLVARTLARTALLAGAGGRSPVATAATGGDVPRRVRALLEPPPRPRLLPLTVPLILLVISIAATATVQHRGDQLFDRAGTPPTSQVTQVR